MANWSKILQKVRDHVLIIESPRVQGTGFVIHPLAEDKVTVATARHVVDQAFDWREPLKIIRVPSETEPATETQELFLDVNSRRINRQPRLDLALIHFTVGDQDKSFELPQSTLKMMPLDEILPEGTQIGWCGYPALAPLTLCFFCGHISAWLEEDLAYLVDGVAISGVSGGPAFVPNDEGEPVIIGLVTAYRRNLDVEPPLPGVSLVRAINPIVQYCSQVRDTLEAKGSENSGSQT